MATEIITAAANTAHFGALRPTELYISGPWARNPLEFVYLEQIHRGKPKALRGLSLQTEHDAF